MEFRKILIIFPIVLLTLFSGCIIDDIDIGLQLIMTHVIEPQIGLTKPIMIYDYPASQAALAKIRHDDYPIAERFEVYYKGLELANGFHELNDHKSQ